MVAYAQAQFGLGRWPNLSFEVADARRLPYQERFDLLVSFNALHWVPQPAEALRGMRRALRPQGRAHLRLVTRSTLTSLEEVAEGVRCEPSWRGLFAGFSDPYLRLDADAYVAQASSLGFAALSCHSTSKQWDYGSPQAFFGFCNAGFGAWTHLLPEVRRQEFVLAVMQRYLAQVDAPLGERFVFHFNQTDIVLGVAAVPLPPQAMAMA